MLGNIYISVAIRADSQYQASQCIGHETGLVIHLKSLQVFGYLQRRSPLTAGHQDTTSRSRSLCYSFVREPKRKKKRRGFCAVTSMHRRNCFCSSALALFGPTVQTMSYSASHSVTYQRSVAIQVEKRRPVWRAHHPESMPTLEFDTE